MLGELARGTHSIQLDVSSLKGAPVGKEAVVRPLSADGWPVTAFFVSSLKRSIRISLTINTT
jgi:hypothetical protein